MHVDHSTGCLIGIPLMVYFKIPTAFCFVPLYNPTNRGELLTAHDGGLLGNFGHRRGARLVGSNRRLVWNLNRKAGLERGCANNAA